MSINPKKKKKNKCHLNKINYAYVMYAGDSRIIKDEGIKVLETQRTKSHEWLENLRQGKEFNAM